MRTVSSQDIRTVIIMVLVQLGCILQENQNPATRVLNHRPWSLYLKWGTMVWRKGRSSSLSAQYVRKVLGHRQNRQSTGSTSMLTRTSINVSNVVKSLVQPVIIKKTCTSSPRREKENCLWRMWPKVYIPISA